MCVILVGGNIYTRAVYLTEGVHSSFVDATQMSCRLNTLEDIRVVVVRLHQRYA